MPNNELIFERMVGDRLTPISATLTQNGSVVDLTGKTVAFRMITAAGTVIIDNAAATVVSAAAGTVSYSFAAVDVATVGTYYGWWIVISGGLSDHFPHDGRKVRIVLKSEDE